MARGRTPSQVVTSERVMMRGPEPIGTGTESAIDMLYGLGMDGAAGSHIPIGMPSASAGVNRFSGDCGPIQAFGRGRFMGATPSIGRSLYASQSPGLPGPSSLANPVLLAMMNNSVGVGG